MKAEPAMPQSNEPRIPITPLPIVPHAGRLRAIREGMWAGWYQWDGTDPFEDTAGPFYVARDAQGLATGFCPRAHNLNGHGIIHGGSLMTFADFSLFMLSGTGDDEVSGVTVTLNCEFLSAAQPGHVLIGRGERTGGGRNLVFARGIISAGDTPVLAFSGAMKRFRTG